MIPTAWHLAFAGSDILVHMEGDRIRIPDTDDLTHALGSDAWGFVGAQITLPTVLGRSCHAYDLPRGFEPPPGFAMVGLRALFESVPPEFLQAAGTALQKVEWLRTHGFCSRCGHPTKRHPQHQAMACPSCGYLHFPRLSPAVIVLVERDREMLLARSPRFPEGMFSTLAGFVEPGESLEDTVHREILEEVGVAVTDLRYFGSQPWPFPHSLMTGFTAQWAGGEIHVDGEEVVEAAWFSQGRLPPRLPSPFSIARRLVDDFLERTRTP